MKSHTLRLHPIPFNKISNGKKTIESRLNDEKRQQKWGVVGIEFKINSQTTQHRPN